MRSSGSVAGRGVYTGCLTAPSCASLSPHKRVRRITMVMRCNALPSARDHSRLMSAVAQARDLPQAQPALEEAHGRIM